MEQKKSVNGDNMYNQKNCEEIYLSDTCDVYYLSEKNLVLVHWKKYCELETYRTPLNHALRVIREHKGCNYVADTRDGFEDNPLDDELEGQERDSSSLLEFRYIYDLDDIIS